jgi:streptogramin lyase
LGRVDPATGLIQEFAVGINTNMRYDTARSSIAEAPDGSIWFFSNHQLTRFTPTTNALDTFNLSSDSTPLNAVTIGADGNVWVMEEQPPNFGIARLDPATGAVQNYVVGLIPADLGVWPRGIGIAPDGKIWMAFWFANSTEERVLDPTTGAVEDPLAPPTSTGPTLEPIGPLPGIDSIQPATLPPPPALWVYFHDYSVPPKIAPDGSYWALHDLGGAWEAISGYDPSTGKGQLFPIDGAPIQLTPGPDGNIWFTNTVRTGESSFLNEIGELNPATGAITYFVQATPSQTPPTSTGNPPPATGTTLSALAGIDFVGAVASFTPQTPITSPGQAYQATVDWGDGTTSSIVLMVTANGPFDVVAGHTYQAAGTYSIKVTIGNYNAANPLGDNAITVFSTANVDPFDMNM